jgi:hypothetical protein
MESGLLHQATRLKIIPCCLISGNKGITTRSSNIWFILDSSSWVMFQYDKSSKIALKGTEASTGASKTVACPLGTLGAIQRKVVYPQEYPLFSVLST